MKYHSQPPPDHLRRYSFQKVPSNENAKNRCDITRLSISDLKLMKKNKPRTNRATESKKLSV